MRLAVTRHLTTFAAARLPGVLILLLCLAGCSSPKTIDFRVVDAETGEPLEGVRVARSSHNASFFSGPVDEHAQLPPTGRDGRVTASNLRPASGHFFLFTRDDYQRARAGTGGANWRTIHIYSPWLHPGPHVREWTPRDPPVEQRLRGVIRIPLHKRNGRPAHQPAHQRGERRNG
jgi:hypothetical protein